MQGTHVTYDTSCYRMKGFLSFFFVFQASQWQIVSFFPHCFLSCRGRSTAPFNSLEWINFLKSAWRLLEDKQTLCMWLLHEWAVKEESTTTTWPLRDTALLLQEAQARSGCSRSSEISWWKPWHIPSHLSHCSTLAPVSCLFARVFPRKAAKIWKPPLPMDAFSFISSDRYVQSPFSTCVTATRAVGAPWLQSWTQSGLK